MSKCVLQNFSQYQGNDPSTSTGREIIAWIRQEQIAWQPTAWAIDMRERKIRAATPTVPAPDLVGLARERIDDRKHEAEETAAAELNAAVGQYISILRRFGSPEEGDADTLGELLEKFKRTDQAVRDDAVIVGKIDKLSTRLAATRLEPDQRRIIKTACDVAARAGWLFQSNIGRKSFPVYRGATC